MAVVCWVNARYGKEPIEFLDIFTGQEFCQSSLG